MPRIKINDLKVEKKLMREEMGGVRGGWGNFGEMLGYFGQAIGQGVNQFFGSLFSGQGSSPNVVSQLPAVNAESVNINSSPSFVSLAGIGKFNSSNPLTSTTGAYLTSSTAGHLIGNTGATLIGNTGATLTFKTQTLGGKGRGRTRPGQLG